MPMKVAFLGLGVMGAPMAKHLANAEHEVTVYNRTKAKADAWLAKYKGSAADTPAKAAANAEVVFSCVGNDDDVRAVTTSADGAFKGMKKGAIFVDHTTASAEVARELNQAANKLGLHFLDAPVSGGQAGAEKGTLTVMVGGDAETFEKAKPVIGAFSQAITLMGPTGSGQLTKMVNQICIVGLLQGLSEALNFGLRAGLDVHLVLKAISKGAAQSWQMENRGPTMIDNKFNFGFAVDWMHKDLQICQKTAQQVGADLSITKLIDQRYVELQKLGRGRWDTSSLITLLREAK
jgi:3-hydroxyisobutyrate dehydrogenase-like beta-hydroxyacid dehydrogenase